MDYRKIWEDHYGTIPKDHKNRPFDIHHIDKNRNNNSIENLVALSIEDHYRVHYEQGDWLACQFIASRLGRTFIQPKVKCPHCGKVVSVSNAERWHFDKCLDRDGVDPNTRKWSKEVIDKRVASHRGSTHTMKKATCDFCNREISLNQKKRHEISCKCNPNRKLTTFSLDHINKLSIANKKAKPKIECPHCKVVGGVPQMKQWHFDNCKNKVNGI